MSDQNSNTLQKIKKFSRFITTKVKEKTLSKSQNDAEEDEEDEDTLFQDAMIVRRHSSYIYQPTKREDQAAITLKEGIGTNQMSFICILTGEMFRPIPALPHTAAHYATYYICIIPSTKTDEIENCPC